MRIMLVNKFHYLKGGSEKYYFELAQLLKDKGHEVAIFSMEDEKNIKTDCKEYFVPAFDLNNSSKLKALDVIYNKENKKIMEKALDDFKPDVVHLNNFQRQISASIIDPIVKRNIPIVFTAHDLQAICPAITMMDSNKNPCELCMKGKYINCFKKKCIKESALKSLLGAIEANYYRNQGIYLNKFNFIITPSKFSRSKFIEDGIDKDKIKTLHNFVEVKDYNVKIEDKGYALYFGRLSKEKGILNLLNAFSKLDKGLLYIAGEGPEEEKIKEIVEANQLNDRVKLLGFLNKNQMIDAIRKCRFVVVPSICYENCPYSVIESMAIGKPIIGSNLGGIPELVEDNTNGFIFKYDDVNELSIKMDKLFTNNSLVKKFSNESKELAKEKYSKEQYYDDIIKIYQSIYKKVKQNDK